MTGNWYQTKVSALELFLNSCPRLVFFSVFRKEDPPNHSSLSIPIHSSFPLSLPIKGKQSFVQHHSGRKGVDIPITGWEELPATMIWVEEMSTEFLYSFNKYKRGMRSFGSSVFTNG